MAPSAVMVRVQKKYMEESQKEWDRAVDASDLTALRSLVQKVPRLAVSEPEEAFGWPLHVAASAGDLELTTLLLAAGAPVDALDENGHTPLYIAALEGFHAVCACLRDQGATNFTSEVSPDNLCLPLYDASKRENLEALNALSEFGAKLDNENWNGDTALSQAIKDGNVAAAHLLLTSGADVSSWRDVEDDGTLLHYVVGDSREFTAEWERLLVRFVAVGADVEATDENGWTPLFWAVGYGNTGAVTWLLDHGARFDAREGRNGLTALHVAASPNPIMRLVSPDEDQEEEHSLDLIDLLLKRGLKVDTTDNLGRTPLHVAALSARPLLVELLLIRGANPRLLDHESNAPLDLLLQKDDDPEFDNWRGGQVAETVRVLTMALQS